MNPATTGPMVERLRELIASAISCAKAYDVPALCRRLGLSDGMEDEAFSSKYKNAKKRLDEIPATKIVQFARNLLTEMEDFELSEHLAKIEELGEPVVTELTTRRLIAVFDRRPIAAELDGIEFLRRVWPINRMRSVYETTNSFRSLEDDIIRHPVAN